MRTHLKEIIVSIIALLVAALAIIFFFRSMKTEQSNSLKHTYYLIPQDVNALMVINRPGVFSRMVLEQKTFYDVFAAEVPDMFLSFINRYNQMPFVVLSFHEEGIVCYMQAGNKMIQSFETKLQQEYSAFSPLRETKDGIAYSYYPFAENRFFGCYVHNGIWVGSFSKKLLETVAGRHTTNELSLPPEMTRLIRAFDTNVPLNFIFPTEKMDLRVSQEGVPVWSIRDKWLGADLFVSGGSLCCYSALPYDPSVSSMQYQAMGDVIARQVRSLYPQISLSFQIDKDEDYVYYTGCTPIPD